MKYYTLFVLALVLVVACYYYSPQEKPAEKSEIHATPDDVIRTSPAPLKMPVMRGAEDDSDTPTPTTPDQE